MVSGSPESRKMRLTTSTNVPLAANSWISATSAKSCITSSLTTNLCRVSSYVLPIFELYRRSLRYYFSMETSKLLADIDAEIERLQRARAFLNGGEAKRKPGRPAHATSPKKRTMSAEGRA